MPELNPEKKSKQPGETSAGKSPRLPTGVGPSDLPPSKGYADEGWIFLEALSLKKGAIAAFIRPPLELVCEIRTATTGSGEAHTFVVVIHASVGTFESRRLICEDRAKLSDLEYQQARREAAKWAQDTYVVKLIKSIDTTIRYPFTRLDPGT